MQPLAHTSHPVTEKIFHRIIFDWETIITVAILVVVGSFTYAIYPPPVNAAALGIMLAVFYYSLHKQKPVLFFIQLFIGNFFPFGNKYGGNYNLTAFAAIVFFTAINGRIPFLKKSVFDNAIKAALIIWVIFELLSITGGNFFPLVTQLQNFLSFCMMVYLFYFVSRIPFTKDDYYRIIFAIAVFFSYEFLVALNQKYEFYNSPFAFFPAIDKSIEFAMGIVRISATLSNFEAFGEYCVSLICLLLPAILSGSALSRNRFFYYFSIITILLSIICMMYSGTRSSMLLLPLAVVGCFLFLGKRLKAKLVVFMVIASVALFFINLQVKFIDFSVFEERSEGMEDVTVTSMLNGDAMNRGGLFPYAFKQMMSTGIIGRGYFPSTTEYHYVQFRNDLIFDDTADYHNLYMSSYVLWGAVGFAAMMFLFFYSIYNGWTTYWRIRKQDLYTTDLLLGFNLLFFLLMINQFKIQFIRDVNYFTLIMLLLLLYISLTNHLKQTAEQKSRIFFRKHDYETSQL